MIREHIKVAIADDNREFCELMNEFLSQQPNMEVVGIAHNGEQILPIIEDKKPDVVILDIIMPHLDGIGVLEK